jgi:hypothetical protein
MAVGLACATMNAAISVKEVEISILPSLPSYKTHGYNSCNFLVVNRSSKQRQIELSLISENSRYTSFALRDVSKAFLLAPASAAKVTLYWPHLNLRVPQLLVNIDGSTYDNNELGLSLSGITSSIQYSFSNHAKSILVTKSVPGNVNKFCPHLSKMHSFTSNYLYADMPVSQWPSNWLFYGGYDGIMLTTKDLATIPRSVKEALEQYVRLGGVMVIYSPTLKKRMKKTAFGFGTKFYINIEPEKLKFPEWKKLFAEFNQSHNSLRQAFDTDPVSANNTFKVAKDFKIPVRQLFLIMLVFAIIIGPVNFYVLNRRKKRIWLLWTSPVIALIFSGIVIFYIFYSEGWHSRIKIKSLTFLDENSRTASSLGIVAYYCPIVPSSGLMFSNYTELQPYFRYQRDIPSVTLNLTVGQNLRNGWLRSRIPAHFTIRKGESRRERLEIVKRTKDGIEVLNGLGSEITILAMVDFDGRKYMAKSIPPGRKVVLKAGTTSLSLPEKGLTCKVASSNKKLDVTLRSIFASKWLDAGNLSVPFNSKVQLSKGTYYAKLKKSPFVSPGMKGGELDESCTIFAKMATGGNAK